MQVIAILGTVHIPHGFVGVKGNKAGNKEKYPWEQGNMNLFQGTEEQTKCWSMLIRGEDGKYMC